jgi:hypothetical protein
MNDLGSITGSNAFWRNVPLNCENINPLTVEIVIELTVVIKRSGNFGTFNLLSR